MPPRQLRTLTTFDPRKYQAAGPEDVANSNRVVTKGDTRFNLDHTDLENDLRYLRNYAGKKINSLDGDLKKCYQRITNTVGITYNTDVYPSFIDSVTKHFKDVKHPVAGTIGGYFAGCLRKDASSCSPMCAGAVPNGKDEPCQYPVLSAKRHGKNKYFNFTYYGRGGGKNKDAYIWVDYDSSNSFPGFCDRDRHNLKSRGIENVQIYGKRKDGKYVKLTDNFVSLNKVKSQISYGSNHNSDTGLDGGTISIILIFLVFFIALVVVALGSRRDKARS